MNRNRFFLVLLLIVGIVLLVLAVTTGRRLLATEPGGTSASLSPGSVPIYLNGELMGAFTPEHLEGLPSVKFTDVYEEKLQDGWLLSQVILEVVRGRDLFPEALVVVSSLSREKSAELTWAEVEDPANYVLLDLSNRGALKLVSVLPRLDGRNEWVQEVDRIDIRTR